MDNQTPREDSPNHTVGPIFNDEIRHVFHMSTGGFLACTLVFTDRHMGWINGKGFWHLKMTPVNTFQLVPISAVLGLEVRCPSLLSNKTLRLVWKGKDSGFGVLEYQSMLDVYHWMKLADLGIPIFMDDRLKPGTLKSYIYHYWASGWLIGSFLVFAGSSHLAVRLWPQHHPGLMISFAGLWMLALILTNIVIVATHGGGPKGVRIFKTQHCPFDEVQR